jgi:hypothetical protein
MRIRAFLAGETWLPFGAIDDRAQALMAVVQVHEFLDQCVLARGETHVNFYSAQFGA